MPIDRRFPLGFAVALACMLSAAGDVSARGCAPRVESAWLRLPPGGMPMLAGFARIENPCSTPVVITGARSRRFGDVSLHESRLVDGMSRMRAVPRLTVPARGTVSLQPGGLHLMLMGAQTPVAVGDRVEIELDLDDGRTLRADWPVQAAAR